MASFAVRNSRRVWQAGLRFPRLNWITLSHVRRLATEATDASNLPLVGIKVLDMTRVLAGVSHILTIVLIKSDRGKPYCTQILGDLGYGMEGPVWTNNRGWRG